MKKVNLWRRWFGKKTKAPQVIIPESWMRYIVAVLPDANQYMCGEDSFNIRKINHAHLVSDNGLKPLVGMPAAAFLPAIDFEDHGDGLTFKFPAYSISIYVPCMLSIAEYKAGGLSVEVESYHWDFGNIRMISDSSFSAIIHYLEKRKDFDLNFIDTCLITERPEYELGTIAYEEKFREEVNEKLNGKAFMVSEGELPPNPEEEEKDGES